MGRQLGWHAFPVFAEMEVVLEYIDLSQSIVDGQKWQKQQSSSNDLPGVVFLNDGASYLPGEPPSNDGANFSCAHDAGIVR